MAAITSLSDLVNRMTGGNSGTPENAFVHKIPYVLSVLDTWAAGLLYSTWKYDGIPSAGVSPTTVAAPTKATTGALLGITNAGGGREKWLVQAMLTSASPTDCPMILCYDRLIHIGGLSGTVATAQTVGGTLTRNTGGVGNVIFVEIYTAVGTTARTITASYTNSGGTSGRTTVATTFGGTVGTIGNDAQLMIPLPLQAGDLGVQSVESVTISVSTGTAGDFGVTIAKPIFWGAAGGQNVRDFTTGPGGMTVIPADACIAFAMMAGSTSEVPLVGMLCTVEA